jgi:hypothetical protein
LNCLSSLMINNLTDRWPNIYKHSAEFNRAEDPEDP